MDVLASLTDSLKYQNTEVLLEVLEGWRFGHIKGQVGNWQEKSENLTFVGLSIEHKCWKCQAIKGCGDSFILETLKIW